MNKIFKGFALALSMLTIIPFFKIHDFYKGINGYAVMSYPLIGLILGGVLYLIYSILNPCLPLMHLAIIIFALWVLLTGALHLDGFSDTVDGLFVNKDRALEVMKDPNTGGMGMIFTVTFLILKASTLAQIELFYLLPLILMLARLNAILAIYFCAYVSPNGMSALAKEEFSTKQLLVAIFYSVSLVAYFDMWVLLISSLFVFYMIKLFFVKRYGGFTGDIYGFTIEVTELILLNILILGLKT